MTASRLARLAFLTLALCVASTSYSKPPSEFDQHVAEGKRFYAEREYDKALAEFDAAYRLKPDPILLLNSGRCHFNAGRPKQALEAYEQMLKLKLEPEDRDKAIAGIAKATRKLAEQQQAAVAAAQEQAMAAQQAVVAQQASAAQRPDGAPAPIYRKGWFWAVVGGSVAVVGLAIGLGVGLGTRSPPVAPVDVVNTQ